MPFLPPNQQRQSTEGTSKRTDHKENIEEIVDGQCWVAVGLRRSV